MKSATQLALYGTIAIVLTRIFYVVNSLGLFNVFETKIFLVTNTIDLLGSISLVNFFYVLYQKQNVKPKQNE